MFKIGDKLNILYGGKYLIDLDDGVYSSAFDGGLRVFLDKYNRCIFIDCNDETKQCYGVSFYLSAFKYHMIEYNLPKCERRKLYYETTDKDGSIYTDFDIKCYVDMKNNLILIGDISTEIKPICVFDDTYVVIDKNKLRLLIIQLDENIIEQIKTNKLLI